MNPNMIHKQSIKFLRELFWKKHLLAWTPGDRDNETGKKDFWTQTFITKKQAEKTFGLQIQSSFYRKRKRTQRVVPSGQNAWPRATGNNSQRVGLSLNQETQKMFLGGF